MFASQFGWILGKRATPAGELRILVWRTDGVGSTRLRKHPDSSKGTNFMTQTIPNGERVIAGDTAPGGWVFVEFGGERGWIQAKHVRALAVSINASWATQLDVRRGTEKHFVGYCQRKYGRGSQNDLPPCTKLWVKEAQTKNPAFLAVQEGVDNIPLLQSYLPNFDVFTKKNTTKGGLQVMVHVFVNKLISKRYRAPSVPSPYQGTWERGHPDRPIQIIWSTDGHYLVNCHAPHNLNRQEIETGITNALIYESSRSGRPRIRRVTAFGDFNDHAKPPHLSSSRPGEISIGLRLSRSEFLVLRADRYEESCCFPGFKAAGDYVLDTAYARDLSVFGNKKMPYSDHRGVRAWIPL